MQQAFKEPNLVKLDSSWASVDFDLERIADYRGTSGGFGKPFGLAGQW
jgi:hypothetical protein